MMELSGVRLGDEAHGAVLVVLEPERMLHRLVQHAQGRRVHAGHLLDDRDRALPVAVDLLLLLVVRDELGPPRGGVVPDGLGELVGALLHPRLGLREAAVGPVELRNPLQVAQVARAFVEDERVEREPRQRQRREDERQDAEEPVEPLRRRFGGRDGSVVRAGILPERRGKKTIVRASR